MNSNYLIQLFFPLQTLWVTFNCTQAKVWNMSYYSNNHYFLVLFRKRHSLWFYQLYICKRKTFFLIWYFAGSENTGHTLIVEKTSGTRQTRGPVLNTGYFSHPAHSAGLFALTQIICRSVLRTVSSCLFNFSVTILFLKSYLAPWKKIY